MCPVADIRHYIKAQQVCWNHQSIAICDALEISTENQCLHQVFQQRLKVYAAF